MPGSRRFPPRWTVEETAPCFIVRDGNGQARDDCRISFEPALPVLQSA